MDVSKWISILLSVTSLFQKAGINYREILDAQDQAAAEGRELTDEERQGFIDQSQSKIDQL